MTVRYNDACIRYFEGYVVAAVVRDGINSPAREYMLMDNLRKHEHMIMKPPNNTIHLQNNDFSLVVYWLLY
jgi:hypothetical protein